MPPANPAGHIGALRWPIRLVTQMQEPGVDTGIIETYTNERTVRAAIEAVSGATFYLGKQVGAEVTHKVTIRWIDDVDLRTRVQRDVTIGGVSRTEDYIVRNLSDPTGTRRFLTLFVTMVATGQ